MTVAGCRQERRRNHLLEGLPAADLALLTPHLQEVSLPRDTVLHEQQDLIEHVYFPHDGMISLVMVMRNGKTIETAKIGWESALGMAVVVGLPRAMGRAVVQLSGAAACFPAAEFRTAALESKLLRNLAAHCTELLVAQIQQSAICHAMHDVTARLSRWLLESSDRGGSELPLTQDWIAQMLSVTRTTVTVAAGTLQSAGVIECHRGIIHIIDRPALERSACECYQAIRQRADGLLPLLESRPETSGASWHRAPPG
jgi:CRP-like cAMP-binding protein